MGEIVRGAPCRRWIVAFGAALATVPCALAQQEPPPGDVPPPQPESEAAPAPAEPAPPGPSPFGFGATDYTLRAYSTYEASADLRDDPGSVSVLRVGAAFDASMPINRTTRLRLDARSEYVNFDFRDEQRLRIGNGTPFEELSNHRLGLGIEQQIHGKWSWTGRGRIRDGVEGGAKVADGLSGDLSGGVLYEVHPGVRLGLGAAVLFPLEDDPQVLPIPLIDARFTLNEHWTLSLGVPSGAAFRYAPSRDLAINIGVTAIWQDYRLSGDNQTPEGVFREFSIPLMVSADWRFAEAWTAQAGIGTNLYQRLDINDREGNDVVAATTEFAPLFMLGVKWDF